MTMTCPSGADLLRAARGAPHDDHARSRVDAHVRGCAACQEAVRDLRSTTSALRGAAPETVAPGACLEEWALAMFVAGSASPSERASWAGHLAECGNCRANLAGVSAALRDPVVSAEMVRLAPPPARRTERYSRGAWVLGPALAAAALLMVLQRDAAPDRQAPRVLRDEAIPTAALEVLRPRGIVAEAAMFGWRSFPDADTYRVTVFDPDGTLRWETRTADTLVITSSAGFLPPGRYFWKVEARTAFDRWVGSTLTEFRVVGPGGRDDR